MDCRCPTCLREERRDDQGAAVLNEGGQRGPGSPRVAFEWAILREAIHAGDGVVGPCPACQMPMLGGTGRTWTLTLASGDITLRGDELYRGSGAVTVEEVDALVEAERPTQSLFVRVFQTGLFAWLVVPFILWVCAFFCFSAFLCIGVPQGAEFMPR